MKGFILGMLAETSIHAGMGQAKSVIDLPVAREATTGYPIIPGSSLKGVLREQTVLDQKSDTEKIFGSPREIGSVGITDARLLLLPIRTLTGHYRWVTCPYLLERFERDLLLISQTSELEKISVENEEAIIGQKIESLFLEEFSFDVRYQPEWIRKFAEFVSPLIKHESVCKRLEKQIAVISDHQFSYFTRNALPVQARNVLDEKTKTSKNLWYEETLPPDTVMYSIVLARPGKEKPWENLKGFLNKHPYLQAGGNESVGQGWFITKVME